MSCSGKATETCGGRDAISVYKRDAPGAPSPTPNPTLMPVQSSEPPMSGGNCEKPQGCYKDDGYDRVLDEKFIKSNIMDAAVSRSVA